MTRTNKMPKLPLFKCPKCGVDIFYVRVYSQCYQNSTINHKGEITEYGTVEEILETECIECPECNEDITKSVKQ